jgi:hypothetical protein
MKSKEQTRLIHRTEDLRRLFEVTTDSQARTAINAEIAKHVSLIAEIDNKRSIEGLPADQHDEVVAQARRDTIS